MNAEGLTLALGGRWNVRTATGLAPCLSHDDRNPSLSFADKGDGRVVFICRAGCSQGEVIAALVARGLWSAASVTAVPPAPVFRWEDHLTAEAPPMPPCCLRGPEDGETRCEHWRQFDADITLARLRMNLLDEAADEVSTLYKTARYDLDAAALRAELNLAVECAGSAIVPWHLDPLIVRKAIDLVVDEVMGRPSIESRNQ
jgi:hypothetical protein